MFLIPFPFSDILCFAYMLITWFYLVFGMVVGLKHDVKEQVNSSNTIECSATVSPVDHSNIVSSYFYSLEGADSHVTTSLLAMFVCVSIPILFLYQFLFKTGHFGPNPSKRGPPSFLFS
jgi:hypothetical protein